MHSPPQLIPVWAPGLSVHNAELDHQHIVLLELSRELWCLLSERPRTTALTVDLLTDLASCYNRHHATEIQILAELSYPQLANYREAALFTTEQVRWYLSKAQQKDFDRVDLRIALGEWIEHHLFCDTPVGDFLRNRHPQVA